MPDQQTSRTVLGRFPAGHPRGSWPADEYAAAQRTQGLDAHVVMDLGSDQFLVVAGRSRRCGHNVALAHQPVIERTRAERS
ncbi:hypothetical protein [Streptomyces sp. NPDC001054]